MFFRQILKMLKNSRDEERFLSLFPEMYDYRNRRTKIEAELEPFYRKYIQTISSPDMTISLQTACFLFIFAESLGASRILDLGSGFSSFVFRFLAQKYSHSRNIMVCSVDDNPYWLEKTAQFLKTHNLKTSGLLKWDKFREQSLNTWDLIFYDLGNMDTRIKNISLIFKLIYNSTVIILDDLHKKRYNKMVKKEVKKYNLKLFSLRPYTLDEYGRFCGLVIPNFDSQKGLVSEEIISGMK